MWSRGDDLALAVAWVVALAASAWLFVATGACVVALGLSRPRLARRISPVLPAGLRRWVEVAIVSACVALPALPAQAVTPARVSTVVDDQPVVRAPETARPAPAPTPAIPPPQVRHHAIVRAGDSLWLIARARLTDASGRAPADAEVANYWRAVIAANRPTLRSGDPSLIYPGEILVLPPVSAVS
jgi:nucleoid-associated protein YgaU